MLIVRLSDELPEPPELPLPELSEVAVLPEFAALPELPEFPEFPESVEPLQAAMDSAMTDASKRTEMRFTIVVPPCCFNSIASFGFFDAILFLFYCYIEKCYMEECVMYIELCCMGE